MKLFSQFLKAIFFFFFPLKTPKHTSTSGGMGVQMLLEIPLTKFS